MGKLAELQQVAKREAVTAALGGVRRHQIFEFGCPKCGTNRLADQSLAWAETRWCPGSDDRMGRYNMCHIAGQHLHCHCRVCGFAWLEQTKDANEIGEKASPVTEG